MVRALAIGLKPLIGMANYAGYTFQAAINGGTFYTFKEFQKWNAKLMVNVSSQEIALMHLTTPLNEDVSAEFYRKLAYKKGVKSWVSTWTFSDVMMITNSFGERKLQMAHALAMGANSMVVDGEIVNIRQYLRKQDNAKKYEKDEKTGSWICCIYFKSSICFNGTGRRWNVYR